MRKKPIDAASVYQNLCELAAFADGSPAWPRADSAGVSPETFRARIRRGESAERAVRPVRDAAPSDPFFEWEELAVSVGVSRRQFRARLRSGLAPFYAAEAWNADGPLPESLAGGPQAAFGASPAMGVAVRGRRRVGSPSEAPRRRSARLNNK